MSEVKKFGEAELISTLNDIGSKLKEKTRIYLIGGCAMTFMGAKAATKDIDIVVTSAEETNNLMAAMKDAGFYRINRITKEYEALKATVIMERPDKIRFDVFTRKVCGKLEIDEKMQSRATPYKTFGSLEVHLMSGEDILLFKGMTERTTDIDDMLILVQRGIDWNAIRDACFAQKQSEQWADLLGTKLLDLKGRHGIDVPIIKDMLDKADMGLLERSFKSILKDGEMSFKDLSNAVKEKFRYSPSWTRQQLVLLEKRKKVKRKRHGMTILYSMK